MYSLHKDDGIDDIPSNVIPLHEHKRSWFDTWDDTFGAISQLDLTISSSTNIPIVCVGLNKPIWTVVPIGNNNPYYLWLQDFWFGDQNGCIGVQYDSSSSAGSGKYRIWIRADGGWYKAEAY